MFIFSSFSKAKEVINENFRWKSNAVHTDRWQGMAIRQKPEMEMREILNFSFQVPLMEEALAHWELDIRPNLPWADIHFQERVGGEPLNPGESWKCWPWGHSADKFRVHEEFGERVYDHTYMERFWPKYAGSTPRGIVGNFIDERPITRRPLTTPHKGIRFEYGDLNDLVYHLQRDPFSRQAYLPIWFPEDGTCYGRRPCTLGYHFIQREGFLHHTYYIRSCDFVRHWADDCYLAVRLHLWLLNQLRMKDDQWKDVKPGLFTMHIVSLHMFINDWMQRYGKEIPSV